MTPPLLLDMTRAVARRLRGAMPSGIDRVCDAYAARFADRALAVIQLRGHAALLDRTASRALFDALGAGRSEFGTVVARHLLRPAHRLSPAQTLGGLYVNVGHSDFDLPAHWRWVRQRGLRPVYLLHDLIPLTHPELTIARKTARHRGRVTGALHHGAGVIMTTHAAARDLHAFAASIERPLPPLAIAPIAGGSLPQPLHRPDAKLPYFLSVGTIERRKNHRLLLRCWSLLLDRLGDGAPQLVFAGSPGLGAGLLDAEFARDPRLRAHVTLTGGIDDGKLAHLVAGARCMLMPTLAEGFGLPLVEALALGRPVLASDLPALREVGQGVPALLDPHDPAAWADAVLSILAGGAEYQRQQAAIAQFHVPSWSDHFAIVEPWLDGIVSRPPAGADLPAAASAAQMIETCQPAMAGAGQGGRGR